MPATSIKQLEHLERLNGLPQTRANGFQRGHKPWNAGTKVYVERTCQFCGEMFLIVEPQLKRDRGIYCSLKCFYDAKKKFGRRAQIKELYEQGKTIKEIGSELGILPSTVASMLYRMKISNRFGDGIFNSAARDTIRRLLRTEYGIESCELCSYDRATEIVHILEKKNGGQYLSNNCLLFCPNCHHLFDHNLLTDIEKSKLRQIARLNGNLQRRLQ